MTKPERFGRLVAAVFRRGRRQVDIALSDTGYSDAMRAPLLALFDHEAPMRQKDLAKELSLDSTSLPRLLKALREKGLVEWQTDPEDRRAKRIAITPEGHAVATRIQERSLEIDRLTLTDITDEELAITQKVLKQILSRFNGIND